MKIMYKREVLGNLSGGDFRHLQDILSSERTRFDVENNTFYIKSKSGLEIAQAEFWELSSNKR